MPRLKPSEVLSRSCSKTTLFLLQFLLQTVFSRKGVMQTSWCISEIRKTRDRNWDTEHRQEFWDAARFIWHNVHYVHKNIRARRRRTKVCLFTAWPRASIWRDAPRSRGYKLFSLYKVRFLENRLASVPLTEVSNKTTRELILLGIVVVLPEPFLQATVRLAYIA